MKPILSVSRFILFLLSISIFFSSCYKDIIDDFDKPTEFAYDANWVANIAYSDVKLTDFNLSMDDESEFSIENQNNILTLMYYTTKLYSLRGDALYQASLETTNINFTLNDPSGVSKHTKANYNYSINKELKLLLEGMIIDSALLKSGTLTINITSDLNLPYVITLKSDYILDENKQKLSMTKYPSSSDASFTINAKDKYIIMPYGQNSIPVTFEIEIVPGSGTLNFPYHFNVTNTFPNIEFFWLHGQSEKKTEYLSKDMSMSFLTNNSVIKCKAHSAKINIEVKNNVGMPLSLDIDTIILCNPDDNMYIPLITINELLTAKYPAVKGEYATTVRSFDIENFLFNNKTTYLQFRGNGILNNNGIDGNKYFITDSSRYRIHAQVQVPLNIDLYNLSYFDTIAFKLDSMNIAQLESAVFRIQIENNFAFGIKSQVYFLNDTYKIIDSLFSSPLIISKATVDPANNYHLVQSTKASQKVTVTNQRLQKIAKASHVLIRADANVNKNDPYMIFYYDEQKLGIKLGVQAHLKTQSGTF